MKKPEPTKLDKIVNRIVADKGLFPDGDHYSLAEEVVKECIKVLDPTDDLCSMTEDVRRTKCVTMIKGHFGIK